MKLKDLDQEIITISGQKIMMTAEKALTIRSAIVSACELYQADKGSGDTLKAYNIGIKVVNAKGDLELSDEELKLLKKIIEGSQQFVAVVIGRLLDFINQSK